MMGLDHGLTRGNQTPSDANDWLRGEEIITWRKENHLHRWFVNNVQNGVDECETYPVTKAQLTALLNVINAVLAGSKLVSGTLTEGWVYSEGVKTPIQREGEVIADTAIAQRLLPTQEGFFFGGTDYDEWYHKSLVETKNVLEPLLAEAQDDEQFSYWSSW